jgi:hypothetical protein
MMIFNFDKTSTLLRIAFLFISVVFVSCNESRQSGEWDIHLIPVEIGNKWGYIDFKGNLVIEPKFDWQIILPKAWQECRSGMHLVL